MAMGSWAFLANLSAGLGPALLAGLVQGALSALITLTLKRSLEALARRLPQHGLLYFILPLILCLGVSLTVLVSAHVTAGTPNVLTTIAVPYSVASTYALIYRYSLWKRTG